MIKPGLMLVAGVLVAGRQALCEIPKSVSLTQLAVDVVTLKSGRNVRGAIQQVSDSKSVTLAVSRDWLQQHQPELAKQALAMDADSQQHAREQIRDRLDELLKAPPTDQRLAVFLRDQRGRAVAALETLPPASQFLWVEVPSDQVARIHRATPDRQRIAMWAWSERLPDVEQRETQDLLRALQARKLNPAAVAPDLSERLPARPQDERQWAARVAIVEYGLGQTLDFQGTPEILVRTNASREFSDLIPVLTRVMKSQVDSLLQELTGELGAAPRKNGLRAVEREAEVARARGFRATTVEVDVERQQVIVESKFMARMPDGSWEVIWNSRETQDASRPRPEAEKRILNDPQVRKSLEALQSFGFGAEDQIQRAVRFGAATMTAQQAAETRFFEFRDRYLHRLDSPPLVWQ